MTHSILTCCCFVPPDHHASHASSSSAAKDEWDFEFLGTSNHPFVKANFPHHEGIWGWGDVADQVVLMVRNMRKSMVEYHDILWDIDCEYAQYETSYCRE